MPVVNKSLHQALESRDPESVVVSDGHTGLVAGQMLARIAQMREWLVSHGIDRVALYCDNSPEWLVLDLACQQSGVVLLPLPLFFSDSQIEHALASSGIDNLIASDAASDAASGRKFLESFVAGGRINEVLNLYRSKTPGSAIQATLPAKTQKITFTSGSTGGPKGVCLSVAQ